MRVVSRSDVHPLWEQDPAFWRTREPPLQLSDKAALGQPSSTMTLSSNDLKKSSRLGYFVYVGGRSFGVVRLGGLLVAMVIVTMVAGCGVNSDSAAHSEGQSSGAASTSSPSKAAYVNKVNAVCRRVKSEVLSRLIAYQQKHGSARTPSAAESARAFKVVILPLLEEDAAAVRDTRAPASNREQVKAIIAAQATAIAKAKQLTQVKSQNDWQKYFIAADEQLESYGLTECNIHS